MQVFLVQRFFCAILAFRRLDEFNGGMHLADRLSVVKPSPTLAAGAKAKALKAQGKDIIDLTLGEPDFDTPAHIKDAAIEAIRAGQTKYTPVDGTAALKAAIQQKFRNQNGLVYEPAQISVANGGKQIIYNALMATLNTGDEVVIISPYWTSYPDMVLLAGGTPMVINAAAENGFKLQPAQLAAAITPKTKWVIINSPSNPCGAAYTVYELAALGAVLVQHPQVLVMSDDLYEHIVYNGFTFHTIAQIVPELYDRTLTVNGVAKAYAMTGWRIGFAGGPKWLIDAMRLIQSQSTSNPCSISQAAAIAAVIGPHEIIRARTHEFETRRDRVHALLNELPNIHCHKPEGAFYLYPDFNAYIGKTTADGTKLADDNTLVEYLMNDCGVCLVAGSAFGTPGFLRLSYATALPELERAMGKLRESLVKLK